MQVQVSKWGNSLGVRLPKALAEHIGASEGQKLTIVAEGRRLVIEPVAPRLKMADLLVNVTPEAMRDAFDWGGDVGRERGDE